MNVEFDKYLNEAIELELNVSDLYLLFYTLFPEDSAFWRSLVIEEKNHASLLKNLRQVYLIAHDFPPEILPERFEDLQAANKDITSTINLMKNNPSRKKAFEYAMQIEQSAGEAHFQFFIDNTKVSEKFEIFQQLNMDDKNHANRIEKYMHSNLL
jgi:hypothetical protein